MMIGRPIGELPSAEQFEALEAKNTIVVAHQQARSKIPPAKLLQNALQALGTAQGDPTLAKIKVDGVIGPATVKATNYAFKTYLNAPAPMDLTYVRQHANYLQGEITKYVEMHGGVVNLPMKKVKPISFTPSPTPSSSSSTTTSSSGLPFDTKYIWWGVAGFSVLLILSVAANAARRRRRDSAAEA